MAALSLVQRFHPAHCLPFPSQDQPHRDEGPHGQMLRRPGDGAVERDAEERSAAQTQGEVPFQSAWPQHAGPPAGVGCWLRRFLFPSIKAK